MATSAVPEVATTITSVPVVRSEARITDLEKSMKDVFIQYDLEEEMFLAKTIAVE